MCKPAPDVHDPREPQIATQLRQHENLCMQTLEQSLTLGTVILITNAAPGWIEASSQEFMPNVSCDL